MSRIPSMNTASGFSMSIAAYQPVTLLVCLFLHVTLVILGVGDRTQPQDVKSLTGQIHLPSAQPMHSTEHLCRVQFLHLGIDIEHRRQVSPNIRACAVAPVALADMFSPVQSRCRAPPPSAGPTGTSCRSSSDRNALHTEVGGERHAVVLQQIDGFWVVLRRVKDIWCDLRHPLQFYLVFRWQVRQWYVIFVLPVIAPLLFAP